MGKEYAVLWGKTGYKGFRKLRRAKLFAKLKANKIKKEVEINEITTYPRARVGEVDWSQTYHSSAYPQLRKRLLKKRLKKAKK